MNVNFIRMPKSKVEVQETKGRVDHTELTSKKYLKEKRERKKITLHQEDES